MYVTETRLERSRNNRVKDSFRFLTVVSFARLQTRSGRLLSRAYHAASVFPPNRKFMPSSEKVKRGRGGRGNIYRIRYMEHLTRLAPGTSRREER